MNRIARAYALHAAATMTGMSRVAKGALRKPPRAYPELRLSPEEIEALVGNPEKMPGVSWLAALFGRVPPHHSRKGTRA